MNARVFAGAAFAVALGASGLLLACVSDEASTRETSSSQSSALETAPADGGSPTFQVTAKEKIDWNGVLSQLGKDNVFRILYKANANPKNRKDDGMAGLDPAEQKILAQYRADMKEVYGLYATRGPNGLGKDESTRVAALQKKYAAPRQELYKVLMARPELSAQGRASLRTAIEQINGAHAMQLDPSSL